MVENNEIESSYSLEYGRYAAEKVAKEHVLREYTEFLTKCSSNLETVSRTFDQVTRGSALEFPIAIDVVPSETIDLSDLVSSDHEELRKIVLALAHLVLEMEFVVTEGSSFYNTLLYYGEGVEEKSFQQGESHACAGRMIETLQKLLNYVSYVYQVVKNAVAQLSKLYTGPDAGPRYFDVGDAHFKIIFERIGSVLACLVTLDSIINRNNLLREHVSQLQHVVRSIQHNASAFDSTPDELRLLDLSLDEISQKALSGTLFLRCVSQSFPCNKTLLEEISANVRGFLEELAFRLEQDTNEQDNQESLDRFLATVCLHVLHAHLGLRVDKKQLKTILDLAKNHMAAVPLTGSCLWFPDQFLTFNLPRGDRAVDVKALEAVASSRFQYLRQRAQQQTKDIQLSNTKVLLWLTRLTGAGSPSSQEELTGQCSLVLQGLRYASRLGASARLLLNLHLAIQPAVAKTTVLAVFHSFELVKTIQSAIEQQMTTSPLAWFHLQQQLRRSVVDMIQTAIKRQSSEKRPRASVLAALKLSERVLNGPCTFQRISVARLSLAIAFTAFRDDELLLLAQRLKKMELLSLGVRKRLARLADCEVFYWHKSLLNTYLAEAGLRHFETIRLGYALWAVNDCRTALAQVKHINAKELLDRHESFVRRSLERHIIEPLCSAVETELRIQSHSHLGSAAGDRNPFKSELPCDLSNQLSGRSLLPLSGRQEKVRIHLSARVEQYLGETFYNLAALASHDWRKYGQMRLLSSLIFDLNPLPDRLPSQTLEQGLDVLEIMRNIHLFVARFGYNLNNQFFVEQSSTSKHLSTIGIKHAANSIRTHGSGVVNTAVNFTYQFLRKKFFVFSQFLFDEQIKSRLMKDARYLRELGCGSATTAGTGGSYPYEKAEKFHRGIRKLGLNSTGLSYLDQFRILITHLGNALGYVRMLRSGSIHCSAESCAPVPDLAELVDLNESSLERLAAGSSTSSSSTNTKNPGLDTSMDMTEGLFESLAKSNPALSALSSQSSRALDKVLDDLAQNLSDSSDYFRLLVDVFRPFFRDPRHAHLRHFYLIVPPLTVNYAEHIVTCKEKLNKKNRQEASIFTDDGFAMGLAYCLSVLDQWKDFDSLQWSGSVRQFFERERKTAGLQSQASQDTLSLTIHRLDTYQQEFDLLFYNVNSARIFFRKDRKTDQSGGELVVIKERI